MRRAIYEPIGDGTVIAEIPGFDGLWANAPTPADCVEELRSVLEGWATRAKRDTIRQALFLYKNTRCAPRNSKTLRAKILVAGTVSP